nr:transporter substrate-binding domain-containing protein [uncultured Rhodoferax sp.]
MNRRNCLRTVSATVSAWLLAAQAQPAGPLVRVGYFDKFSPFSEKDESGQMRGLLVESMEVVAGLAGVPLEHHGYPWARAQLLVKQGELDAFCTVQTAERNTYAEFCATPILRLTLGVYHRRGDARIAQIDSVADLRELRQGGYVGSGYVKEHLEADRIALEPDQDSVLRRLLNGTLDVFPQAELVTWQRIKALGYADRLQFTPLPFLPPAAYSFGLRRNYPEARALLARMETAIQAAHKKNALQALLARYR